MKVSGKIVVVTGGATGIGRALAEVFHREGAARVVIADLDGARAKAVADGIGGAAFACDVGREEDIRRTTGHRAAVRPIELSAQRRIARFDPIAEKARARGRSVGESGRCTSWAMSTQRGTSCGAARAWRSYFLKTIRGGYCRRSARAHSTQARPVGFEETRDRHKRTKSASRSCARRAWRRDAARLLRGRSRRRNLTALEVAECRVAGDRQTFRSSPVAVIDTCAHGDN